MSRTSPRHPEPPRRVFKTRLVECSGRVLDASRKLLRRCWSRLRRDLDASSRRVLSSCSGRVFKTRPEASVAAAGRVFKTRLSSCSGRVQRTHPGASGPARKLPGRTLGFFKTLVSKKKFFFFFFLCNSKLLFSNF